MVPQAANRLKFEGNVDLDDLMAKYLDVAGGAGRGEGGPRIFCSVWTFDKNHGGVAKAVWETWAQRCDGYVAYSNVADQSIGAINMTVPGPRAHNGKENMIRKARMVWQHMYRHYLLDYDYFFQAGDDAYLVVDNLRALLREPQWADPNAQGVPLFVGRPSTHGGSVMNIGGPGVVLNRRALHLLGSRFDLGHCGLGKTGWSEDVETTSCFRELGVVPQDTRDKMNRQLFHPFTPATHAGMNMTHVDMIEHGWFTRGSYSLQDGFDCCSPHSVTFHYCPASLIYKLHKGSYGASVSGKPVYP
jgi:glycoprotein-N-acetylgalactosamine 3-beta-galactosyltransferase